MITVSLNRYLQLTCQYQTAIEITAFLSIKYISISYVITMIIYVFMNRIIRCLGIV